MKDQDRENLAELIERLFGADKAGGVQQDIREGERILRENPAPGPDDALMAAIKSQIASILARRAQRARYRISRRVAVAAAIVIIAAITPNIFNDTPPGPATLSAASLIPTAVWESNDIAADDQNLAVLTAEIEQIENKVTRLESGDEGASNIRTVEELEMELILVSGDFWKERF